MTERAAMGRCVSDVRALPPARVVTAAVVTAFALAAPAAAAVRHAQPGGTVEQTCTQDDPCNIYHAIAVAQSGDEVVLAPGDYGPDLIAGPLQIPAGLDVHGTPGAPRPALSGGGPSLVVGIGVSDGPAAALRHVDVTVGTGTGIDATNARIEDVVVHGPGAAGVGVALHDGAALVGSVVWMTGGDSRAVLVAGTPAVAAALRHVTALAGGPGGTALAVDASTQPAHAAMTNTIVRGEGSDIRLVAPGAGRPRLLPEGAVVSSSHSSYRSDHVDLPMAGSTLTSDADQTAAEPALADPAGGDVHQLAASATIDAGVADPLGPATDIDGEARHLGAAPDIGADERPPPAPAGPVVTPTPEPAGPGPPPAISIDRVTVTGSGAGRTLTIRAHDDDAPMNGVLVEFGNGLALGESACRTTGGAVFDRGRAVEFRVPVPAAAAATATVELRSGGCGAARSQRQRVSLAPTATVATAAVAVAAGTACRGASAPPRKGGERRAAAAVLCLMNQVRRSAGLKPFKSSRKLGAAARAHNADMLARRFYAHEQPPGPALAKRLRKAKWRGGGAGENLGLANLVLASPKGMVAAWLKSPPHRANILSRGFKAAGIAMQASDPMGRLTGAGIYTVDFGTRP